MDMDLLPDDFDLREPENSSKNNKANGSDMIDEMLFGGQSDNEDEEEVDDRVKKNPTEEYLLERLENLKERVDDYFSTFNKDSNALEYLEELERDASRSGIEQVSGVINEMKIKLENLKHEMEQLFENDTLQKLQQEDASKQELHKVQRKIIDIEDAYEDRMENIWQEIEDLELELDENQIKDSFSDDGGFGLA